MSLGKIRDSLTSEINPNLVNNNETKLATDGLTSLNFKGVSKTEQDKYTFISVEL